jgi:D-alanine-D-alanine ligase
MRAADVVYPVLHGGFGEDGTIQALMEQAGIPFVGGSAESCRIVMDKYRSKLVMDQAGIRNAAYALIDDPDAEIPAGMNLPLIVKPNSEGSTFGLSLVRDDSEWKYAIANALKYDARVLVEEFIAGTEATVGIVLGEVYPAIEIQHPGTLYDYDAKYTHAQGETKYFCPPLTIDQAVQKEIAAAALKFAQAVGNTTLIRIDVIVRDSDKAVFMLEGNSLPGFTASSLLPKSIAVTGRTSAEVCSALAYAAFRRKTA